MPTRRNRCTLTVKERVHHDRTPVRGGNDEGLLASCGAFGTTLTAAAAPAVAAEASEFHVARQPGIVYLQAVLMEEKKLIEKQAAALGVSDVKVKWSIITSGGVMTEALISGSIDMAITGVSNMLLLWDRTNGGAKSVAGVAGVPFLLLTVTSHPSSCRSGSAAA